MKKKYGDQNIAICSSRDYLEASSAISRAPYSSNMLKSRKKISTLKLNYRKKTHCFLLVWDHLFFPPLTAITEAAGSCMCANNIQGLMYEQKAAAHNYSDSSGLSETDHTVAGVLQCLSLSGDSSSLTCQVQPFVWKGGWESPKHQRTKGDSNCIQTADHSDSHTPLCCIL